MTPTEVKTRLQEAADVIRRLPPLKFPEGLPADSVVRVQQVCPGILDAAWGAEWEMTASGEWKTVDAKARPPVPAPREIDEAWEAYGWLGYLDAKAIKMMWAWANGIQLWKIGQRYGKSEGQIRYWRDQCAERIYQGLMKRRVA